MLCFFLIVLLSQNILRSASRPAVVPAMLPGTCNVNVLSGTKMSFDLHNGLSFAPIFSLFSSPEAVKISALILAYCYDPQGIDYVLLKGNNEIANVLDLFFLYYLLIYV
jgi:hypothetical protein